MAGHDNKAAEAILEASRYAHSKTTHPKAMEKLKEAFGYAESHAKELALSHGKASAETFRADFMSHADRVIHLMENKGTKVNIKKNENGCGHQMLKAGGKCEKCGYLMKSAGLHHDLAADLAKSAFAFANPTPNPKFELLAKISEFRRKIRGLKREI
jgi:hypothetical protein